MKHQIAIVGLPNSGKTALLTKLCIQRKHIPLNKETFDFENKKGILLQNGNWEEWEATDPNKTPAELSWEVSYKIGKHIVKSKDFAGETWKKFIDTYGKNNANIQQINTKELEEYIKNATNIVICIDSEEFIKDDKQEQKWVPIAIRNFLRDNKISFGRVLIAFTKYDSVKEYIEQRYTDFKNFFEENFAQYFKYEQCIPISVAKFNFDPKQKIYVPVPNSGFGLDKLEKHLYWNMIFSMIKKCFEFFKPWLVLGGIILGLIILGYGLGIGLCATIAPYGIIAIILYILMRIVMKIKIKYFLMLMLIGCCFNMYTSDIKKLESEIKNKHVEITTLKTQKKQFESNAKKIKEQNNKLEQDKQNIYKWSWKYIFGKPKKVADKEKEKIENKIKLNANEIKKCKEEARKIQDSIDETLDKIAGLTKEIKKLQKEQQKQQKQQKQKNESEKLSHRYEITKIKIDASKVKRGTPDLYLKFNQKKFGEAQIDTKIFILEQLPSKIILNAEPESVTTIEVWDEDLGPDNHKFDITIDKNDIKSGQLSKTGSCGNFTWEVVWKQCD